MEFTKLFTLVKTLTHLNLGFCGTSIDDEIMQTIIANLKNLKYLNLCKTAVSDIGLAGQELFCEFQHSYTYRGLNAKHKEAILERIRTQIPGHCLSELSSNSESKYNISKKSFMSLNENVLFILLELQFLDISGCHKLGDATWSLALKLPNLATLILNNIPQASPYSTYYYFGIVNMLCVLFIKTLFLAYVIHTANQIRHFKHRQ